MFYAFVGSVAFWMCFMLLCLLEVILVSVTNRKSFVFQIVIQKFKDQDI
jgi:hypothetical protein